MTPTLEIAFAKVAELPEATQDQIAGAVLEWIDRFRLLQRDLQVGIDQLDAGLGKPLDLEGKLADLHRRYLEKQN